MQYTSQGLPEALTLIGKIRERLRNRRGLNERVAAVMLAAVLGRFDSKTDPDGGKWAPWSKRTRAERKNTPGATLLVLTSEMRGSVSATANSMSATIRIADKKAKKHEFGDPANRLPRRAMLYGADGQLGTKDSAALQRVLLDWFTFD